MKGTYEIVDRLFWLVNCETVMLKSYQKKWERGRKTFFRDIDHLRNFYGINFEYDRMSKVYKKKKDSWKQNDKLF